MMAVLGQIMKGGFTLRRKPEAAGEGTVTGAAAGAEGGERRRGPFAPPTLAEVVRARKSLRSVAPKDREKKEYAPHDTFPFLSEIRDRAATFPLRRTGRAATERPAS